MQRLLANTVAYSEAGYLFREGLGLACQSLQFFTDDHYQMRSNVCYDDHVHTLTVILGLPYKWNSIGEMKPKHLKRIIPCAVKVEFDDYRGLFFLIAEDECYYIDYCDKREVAVGGPSSPRQGYFLFKMSLEKCIRRIDNLSKDEQVADFLEYRPENLELSWTGLGDARVDDSQVYRAIMSQFQSIIGKTFSKPSILDEMNSRITSLNEPPKHDLTQFSDRDLSRFITEYLN
jgi:hypothetical protein